MAVLFLLAVGGAVAKVATSHKTYQADTRLIVVTKSPNVTVPETESLSASLDIMRQDKNVETQTEIVNNPTLVLAALNHLTRQEQIDGFGYDQFPVTEADPGSYDIKSKEDTDVIYITTKASSPEIAVKFANAIAHEYFVEDAQHSGTSAKEAATYVDNELTRCQNDLNKASQALADFQNRTGLVSAPDQVSGTAASLLDLETQYAQAGQDYEGAASRRKSILGDLSTAAPNIDYQQTIDTNPEYLALQTQIVQLEGQIASLAQEFRPTSPEISELRAQLSKRQADLRKVSRSLLDSTTQEANPIRLKALADLADTTSAMIIAGAHRDGLKSELTGIKRRFGQFPSQQKDLVAKQQKVDILTRTYNMLSDRHYELLIQAKSDVASGYQAGSAYAEPKPVSPRVVLYTALGVMGGLVGAVLLALVLEKVDDRLQTPAQLEHMSGLASLALVPEVRGRKSPLIAVSENGTPMVEVFRILRNRLVFLSDTEHRAVGVTSSITGEGKTTVASNLAIVLALEGKRVLIIDSDFREPTIHKNFGLKGDTGFVDLLAGTASLDAAVQPTSYANLMCLPAGAPPANPSEMLGSERAVEVVRSLAATFDYVVVDCPPITGMGDMLVVSRFLDGVLFVAALRRIHIPQIKAAFGLMEATTAKLLGSVISRVPLREVKAAGFYRKYGQSR